VTPDLGLIVVRLLVKTIDTSKIQGHASALLDLHLRLAEKNALLQKLVFDHPLVTHLSGKRSQHLSCAQDIAKITFDQDSRTPSLANIVHTLKDGRVKGQLGRNFSVWSEPDYRSYSDPAIIEALKRIELRESARRLEQFSQLLAELETLSKSIFSSPTFSAFRIVRDKITAHTEIKLVADKYLPIDLGTLSLKWGDINTCVSLLERPVELVGLVVRNSSFAWDSFHTQLEKNVASVWDNAKGAS
jgi:AbiU2